jgi:hypothetical protein
MNEYIFEMGDALYDMDTGKAVFKPKPVGELIRCKECKHRDPEDKKCDCGHDILWQLPRSDEWFCADGERGDADED